MFLFGGTVIGNRENRELVCYLILQIVYKLPDKEQIIFLLKY